MKFDCGPTEAERRQTARNRWCKWHRWFAWFPVKVSDRDCRWLEYVDRRADSVGFGQILEFVPEDFEYRPLTKAD